MAQWRKVVVSGSTAELNGLTLSGDLTVEGGDITLGFEIRLLTPPKIRPILKIFPIILAACFIRGLV